MSKTPRRRPLRRGAAFAFGLLVLGLLAILVDAWPGMGKGAAGARAQRMAASAQWSGAGFENPQPLWNDILGSMTTFGRASAVMVPDSPIPVEAHDGSRFALPPATGLRVTWLGHSTMLVEIDGHRFLTDPIFDERAGPVTWAGPARWYAPPVPLQGLPPLDAVVLSHDHYDHLQMETVLALADRVPLWVVPLGVGAHLEYWGIPGDRIVELDWWEAVELGDLTLTCTPARHASGRQIFDQNATLWAGWSFGGPQHRVFFSGDTGLFPALRDIGARLGPFDLTMIEVGAYNAAWPDWHIGPEQAVQAHQMLGGKAFLPVHWGLWNLAAHGWTEPVERALVAAEAAGVAIAVPLPGQSIEPEALPPVERWWPELPWRRAEEDPIRSTGMGEATAG